MIKPLILKSNNPHESSKSQLFTVDDIVSKFNAKSPNNRICLTDRTPSTTRSISTPNNHFFAAKSPSNVDLNAKQKSNCFKKVKLTVNTNNAKSIFLYQKTESKINSQKEKCSKSQKKLALNLQFLKSKKEKHIISKLVKEVKRHTNLNHKENTDCANKKVTKPSIKKLQRPLTDRIQQKANIYKQIQTFSNVKLDTLQTKYTQAQKSSKQADYAYKFVRKGSNASTLSLKTKHTVSMQQFEDYEELFAKQSNRDDKQSDTWKYSNSSTMNLLEKVKQKIYSQIYSLDKKLLAQNVLQKEKKPITISLRKKQKYVVDRQEQLVVQTALNQQAIAKA